MLLYGGITRPASSSSWAMPALAAITGKGPSARTGWPSNGTKDGAQQYVDWFESPILAFCLRSADHGQGLQTFLDFPPQP